MIMRLCSVWQWTGQQLIVICLSICPGIFITRSSSGSAVWRCMKGNVRVTQLHKQVTVRWSEISKGNRFSLFQDEFPANSSGMSNQVRVGGWVVRGWVDKQVCCRGFVQTWNEQELGSVVPCSHLLFTVNHSDSYNCHLCLFAVSTITAVTVCVPAQAQHLPFTFPPLYPHKVNSGSLGREVPDKMNYTKWCKPFLTISLQLKTKREKGVQVLPDDVNQNPQLDEPAHHSHPPVPHQHLAGSLILKEEVGEGAGDLVLHLLSRLTRREEGLCFSSLAYKNSQEILFSFVLHLCPLPPLMNNLLYSSCEVLKSKDFLLPSSSLSLSCSPSLLLLLSLSLHSVALLSACCLFA